MDYYKIKYLKYKEKYLNFKQKYCVYNKNLDITIFHFFTKNLINVYGTPEIDYNVVIEDLTNTTVTNPTTNKNIKYHKQDRFMSTEEFKKLIEPIITACKTNNILIIIDSRFDPDPSVTEPKKDVYKFMDALRIIDISNNLGDSKSLITHPASTTHRRLSPEDQMAMGITATTIRLSVGLEHSDDLIKDIAQALG